MTFNMPPVHHPAYVWHTTDVLLVMNFCPGSKTGLLYRALPRLPIQSAYGSCHADTVPLPSHAKTSNVAVACREMLGRQCRYGGHGPVNGSAQGLDAAGMQPMPQRSPSVWGSVDSAGASPGVHAGHLVGHVAIHSQPECSWRPGRRAPAYCRPCSCRCASSPCSCFAIWPRQYGRCACAHVRSRCKWQHVEYPSYSLDLV